MVTNLILRTADKVLHTGGNSAASGTADQQVYKCTFRGSTLVDISPRDDSPSSYPLYVRDGMRREETLLKETTRYVADRTILHW